MNFSDYISWILREMACYIQKKCACFSADYDKLSLVKEESLFLEL